MQNPGAINWARLTAVSLIWGGAFMVVSIALRHFEPLQLATSRIGIGAIALYILMRLRGAQFPPLHDRKVWVFIVGIALLSTALPFALLSWGQQFVPSAFAGMTMATVPLFILPLAHMFVPGEGMTPRKVAGFVIGFAGTMILIGTGGLAVGENNLVRLAQVACVVAALCYACNSILTKRCPPVSELALSTAALGIAFAILLPFALIFEGLPTAITTEGMLAIVYLGLLPTAAAYVLKVAIVRSTGPSFMSFVNYFVPCWSVFLGAWFLGERLPSGLFYALGLILLGLALSQWPLIRSLIIGKARPAR